MSDRAEASAVPVEPIFDRTPQPFGDRPPDPIVYDGSARALRQRTVNFAAKRFADMLYVTGLDRETADQHFRWRAVTVPGGLSERPRAGDQAGLLAAQRAGAIRIETDNLDRRVTVTWNDPAFDGPVIGAAIARKNYGSILLGQHAVPAFDAKPIERHLPGAGHAWPLGEAVEPPPPPPVKLVAALKTFFANSTGAYGILIASPEQILVERYSAFGGPDRATPSWSMTKAITCTLIGRLIHDGWLASVYDPAPAPLWRDPRAIHHQITLDHLLRMRSGLAFPVMHDDGHVTLGFENSAVYQDAGDAFEAAQRSIVATQPGSVFRYVNSGLNVLGADHPRPDRAPRPAVPPDGLQPAGRPAGHGELPALRRPGRQPDRLRRGFRHVARLRQAGRVVFAGWRVERRTAAAAGLGRLRADRNAYRHQLCRLLPHQHRSPVPRPAGRIPPGLPARPTSASSSCAGIV